MIRIAITDAALDALAGALPLGNVGFQREPDEDGERLIWLEPRVVAKLRALRGPGESYSDVALRLAEVGHESIRVLTGRLRPFSILPLVSVL
jgi:hypothetical protein